MARAVEVTGGAAATAAMVATATAVAAEPLGLEGGSCTGTIQAGNALTCGDTRCRTIDP